MILFIVSMVILFIGGLSYVHALIILNDCNQILEELDNQFNNKENGTKKD